MSETQRTPLLKVSHAAARSFIPQIAPALLRLFIGYRMVRIFTSPVDSSISTASRIVAVHKHIRFTAKSAIIVQK